MNRRRFLQATTGALVGGGAGCGAGGGAARTGPFAGRNLRVFVYEGGHAAAMQQAFVPKFEAETGATVELAPGWWDGMAKLRAAPANDPPYDLMITDATQGYPAVREGLFRQIDWANVPNRAALVPEATNHWVAEQGYGLTYPDAVMTLAYRAGTVAAAPETWADLLRPEWANRLGIYNHYYLSLYTFACILSDQQNHAKSAQDILIHHTDDVFRLAIETRPQVKLWWPTSAIMILALANGEVAAGNMQSPEYLQAMREKPELAAVVPVRNRAMVQVFWAIPAGTPNADLAEVALNMLFSDEVQFALGQSGSATARPDTAARLAAADPFWASLYPHTDADFRRLAYYPYDFYAAHHAALADRWDRTVLRG